MRIEAILRFLSGRLLIAPNSTLGANDFADRGRHLPFLDVLRGVAILLVFLHHALGAAYGYYSQPWRGLFPDFLAAGTHPLLYPLTLGNCGVAIFFVVSGFCIHLSHRRSQRQAWIAFGIKRFFRIYPPYLVALLAFYLCWPWRTYSLASPGWQHQLWTHIFLLHDLDKATAYGINGSFWSIAIEFQLYLLYPILLVLVGWLGWRASLLLLFAVEVLIRLSVPPESWPFAGLQLSPFAYWFSWTLGAFAADCYLRQRIKRLRPTILPIAFLLALLTYLFYPLAPFAFMAVAMLTSLMVWQTLAAPVTADQSKPLRWVYGQLIALGTVSYSFYLIHQPLLQLVPRFNQQFSELMQHRAWMLMSCLLLYVPILMLSRRLYLWIERPSARLGQWLSNYPSLFTPGGG